MNEHTDIQHENIILNNALQQDINTCAHSIGADLYTGAQCHLQGWEP